MQNNLSCRYVIPLVIILFSFISCGNRTGESGKPVNASDSLKFQLADLNKQIADDVSNPDLYNQRAKLYLLDRQFDKALSDINKAISLASGEASGYITLSDIYLLMGMPDKSNDALKKALSLEPKNILVLLKIAKLNLIIKDYKSTFEFTRQCLETDPVNSQAFFIRAIAFLETGDTLKAVDDLKRTVDLDQSNFNAFVELGELYALKKDNMAAGYFQNALRLKPRNREVLYMLGMFYQESEQFEKALQIYSELELSDTTFRAAPYNIGYIYLVYIRDFEKAVVSFSKAIKIDPTYFEAYYNRGYSYELLGDLKKAYEDYQKTLKISPNYPKAVDGLNRLDQKISRK